MNTYFTSSEHHPIFNPSEFFIETPMTNSLLNKLHSWIWNGFTGGVILGDFRIGKTRAIRYSSNHIVNRLNQSVKCHRLSIARRDTNSMASIFKNLSYSLDIKLRSQATADEMSNDLVHRLGEMALVNETQQVILFVDEMQRLKMRQLEAFAELYDLLSELKINLCVFFIGNYTDSKKLIKQVIESQNGLIRGRFFTHCYIFYGVKTLQDIRSCCKQYDLPYLEKVSVTEHFLPDEFNAGWRVETISDLIWEVFQDEFKSSVELDSWPMQYSTAMMKTLLTDYLPNYGVEDDDSIRDMIIESINVSGLLPDLVETT